MIKLLEKWRENLDKNYVAEGVLTDLFKAFECIPHDLLLSKLSAYGVDETCLCYIYPYLLNRKKCMRINNVNSDFLNIISGVPPGSIVRSILFIVSLMTCLTLLKLIMPTSLQTILL